MLNDSTKGYGLISIALHWIVAALVVFLYVSGEMFDGLPRGEEARALRALHNSVGAMASVFFVGRFVWRLMQGTPQKSAQSAWLNVLALIVQWGLLMAILGAVVTGFGAIWSGGRAVDVFGLLSIPSPMAANGTLHRAMEEVHEFCTHIMLPLAALHVLGAIKHAVIDRDGLVRRMLVPVR